MAEKDNTFQNTVEALFRGMDSFITTKTVVGEAIHIDDTILLPLVDVSFGVGAGAFAENAKNNAGGGMGGKISPSAVLVISKNGTRLVNIKNQDAVTEKQRSEVLLHTLEDRQIYVSAGSACSSHKRAGSPTLTAIGASKAEMESAVRFSFSEFTTLEQIDYTLDTLREVLPMLRRFTRK